MPESKKTRWKIITSQLRNKYRLVILNDSTFAEKVSFKLSPLSLLILLGSVTLVMTTLVISLVAFTPLREYIPGYGNVNERKTLLSLTTKADSMEQVLQARDWYMQNLVNVISGKTEGLPPKPGKDSTGKYKNIDIKPSDQDMEMRREVEKQASAATVSNKDRIRSLTGFFFFSPLKGIVTTSFNLGEDHYGIDIASKENEFVKATLDGTVVFSGFTSDDGYVIQVQHANNLTSVYKHTSELLKKTGDNVTAGEPLGIVGNTGESSKGPHLHFEIWYNGIAINPEDYIAF